MSKNRFGAAPGATQQIIGTKLGYDGSGAWFFGKGKRGSQLKRSLTGYKGNRGKHPVKITLAGRA